VKNAVPKRQLDKEKDMKQFYILLMTICFSYSIILAQNDKEQLDFDNFKSNLKKDMDYKTIVKTFGQPDNDIGSGIYIYIYKLSDSTTMIIGCTNKVFYANHYDKNGDLLHLLIGDSKLKCNPAILEYTYLAMLRPEIKLKEATINDQEVYTAQAGQLILYNDYAHTAWIADGRYGYIPPEDLVKIDTFYFRFDFSKKDFQLDSKNDLFEINKKRGIDINKITDSVLNIDLDALYNLFLLRNSFDGASAEIFPHHFWSLLMTWNDKNIADFITNLKVKDKKQFVEYITDNDVTFPIERPLIYYELYYPKTFELIKKYK
jgi:hypothetical protein